MGVWKSEQEINDDLIYSSNNKGGKSAQAQDVSERRHEDWMRMDRTPSRVSDTQQTFAYVNYLPCLTVMSKRLGIKL